MKYNNYLFMCYLMCIIGNPSSRAYSEFIEEATMMMEFQHENVLTIYGVMIKEDKPFVILPFMENGDLHSYLVQPSNVSFNVIYQSFSTLSS